MGLFHYDKKKYPRYNDSGKLVHRVVARAPSGTVVHHKDGNTKNFRSSNLRVMSRSSHARLHNRLKRGWF